MMTLIVYLGSCRMFLQHCLSVSYESIDQNGQIVTLMPILQPLGRQVLVLFHHHESEVLEGGQVILPLAHTVEHEEVLNLIYFCHRLNSSFKCSSNQIKEVIFLWCA